MSAWCRDGVVVLRPAEDDAKDLSIKTVNVVVLVDNNHCWFECPTPSTTINSNIIKEIGLLYNMKYMLATSLLLAVCSSHPTLRRDVQPTVNITDADILQYALTLEHLGTSEYPQRLHLLQSAYGTLLMHPRGQILSGRSCEFHLERLQESWIW